MLIEDRIFAYTFYMWQIFLIFFAEGEQEAAWLQEAGYGFIVSKFRGKYYHRKTVLTLELFT